MPADIHLVLVIKQTDILTRQCKSDIYFGPNLVIYIAVGC